MGDGYPPGAIERLQQTSLDILEAIAGVCDELGLQWFIESGTLLGAVRHGGFIPWDDDIDVAIVLDDWRVFCSRAGELLPEGYGVYLHGATEGYAPLWAKVYKEGTRFVEAEQAEAGFEGGIFVDVFAYVQLDSDPRRARRQTKGLYRWQHASYLYHSGHPKLPPSTPLRGLVKAACVLVHGLLRAMTGPAAIERRFWRALEGGDGQGKWVNAFYSTWGQFDDAVLFPTKPISFEGSTFPGPADPARKLELHYGDYMQLPPVERRVGHAPAILDFGDGVNVVA